MNLKQKGKQLELYVADRLKEVGLDNRARIDGGSGAGNREKRDISTNVKINCREIGIECKNHKVPHIKDWWKQTEKLDGLGFEPVLIYSLGGERIENCKVVIYFETFLDILKKNNKPTMANPSKELEWDLVNLQNAIKKLRKHFKS
jgi:hypothetical protein